jgi:hypothetical protein
VCFGIRDWILHVQREQDGLLSKCQLGRIMVAGPVGRVKAGELA